jgi:hypothetical protein
MPIDMQQFKEASKPLGERVLEFLSKDPNQAYSIIEIAAAVEGYAPDQISVLLLLEGTRGQSKTWDRYAEVLTSLVEQRKVAQAVHKGSTYYAAAKP